MNKLIIAGLFVAGGFTGLAAIAPASAAPAGSVPYCSSSINIDGNAATIKQQLRGYGCEVQSVEEWNGCVRAFVEGADGNQQMAYFDPDTLQLLTTTEDARG